MYLGKSVLPQKENSRYKGPEERCGDECEGGRGRQRGRGSGKIR